MEKRTATLLSCIGSDAYDVFQQMVFEDESHRQDIEKVIKAFDDYFIGETNVTYERYLLNKRTQEANESFDSFLTELRRLVRSCDYGSLEESILKDRIVIGIRDDATRRKLLQIRQLQLTGAVDICRASEAATRHLKEFRGTEEVHKLSATKSSRNRQRSLSRADHRRDNEARSTERADTRRSEDRQTGRKNKCKYCCKYHEFRKELCPAYMYMP